jgi:hypothetical protein
MPPNVVDTVALERLGDQIAELAAHVHAATYRLLVMIAEFDRGGGWGVDAETLRAGSASGQAALAGGIRLSAETCRRIACDASRVVMIHDGDGAVLDVGRRTRIVPTSIRRALEHRDGGCRFPGCGCAYAIHITFGTGPTAARRN